MNRGLGYDNIKIVIPQAKLQPYTAAGNMVRLTCEYRIHLLNLAASLELQNTFSILFE